MMMALIPNRSVRRHGNTPRSTRSGMILLSLYVSCDKCIVQPQRPFRFVSFPFVRSTTGRPIWLLVLLQLDWWIDFQTCRVDYWSLIDKWEPTLVVCHEMSSMWFFSVSGGGWWWLMRNYTVTGKKTGVRRQRVVYRCWPYTHAHVHCLNRARCIVELVRHARSPAAPIQHTLSRLRRSYQRTRRSLAFFSIFIGVFTL